MLPHTPSLVDAENVREGVDAALARHVADLGDTVAPFGTDADPLLDAVARMVAGGKRLRAAFCWWSWRAHGGRPGTPQAQALLRVGAALELFQAAALFHDDVMDGSDTRRGLPAAHRAFAARHHEHAWTGDADRFGESVAILLGDLSLVASEQELAAALRAFDEPEATAARAVFDLMRTEVTVGQYLDVLAQALPWGEDPLEDEARARRVIRAKAARYSVEHPLVLGALLAGADEAEVAACREIGLPLGEAFQLRDDLLGVFGDPVTTGKPAGDDLREGKRTVLVARAAALAAAAGDDEAVATLTDRLGAPDLDDEEVARLADLVRRTGAPDQVEALIAELAGPAFALMEARPWPEPARGHLVALAHAAVDRRA
ncbi:polyprenyl synthetase family protein [Cellulomonas oligotrophica]|uniref:Geranylgeranyl diphosphate synthase type I n=1 Tax=Cellulomonas oligotrophica TaxID=931536 RepID=A0A7Y9JWU9_9CELL|nr:polyprenyl synthetase family protein [Cellulomonas oligotrophica]NYD84962.1 geranylgeranyl diphosphate synthase type I [Cellulomonas oligotrophica]GIG32032.1 geranylgeranyl pyrophosphate synthase [Cellulomonas oligotrophica]